MRTRKKAVKTHYAEESEEPGKTEVAGIHRTNHPAGESCTDREPWGPVRGTCLWRKRPRALERTASKRIRGSSAWCLQRAKHRLAPAGQTRRTDELWDTGSALRKAALVVKSNWPSSEYCSGLTNFKSKTEKITCFQIPTSEGKAREDLEDYRNI